MRVLVSLSQCVCVCARVRWVFVGVSGFVTFSWQHFLFLATLRGSHAGLGVALWRSNFTCYVIESFY